MRRDTQDTPCDHASPVTVNPVKDGGWRARCLRCGILGPVGADSIEALGLIQRNGKTRHPGAWRDPGSREERSGRG